MTPLAGVRFSFNGKKKFMSSIENILCMKWGTKYGPEYVNRLAAMVQRNMRRPYRLYCFTEDGAGIDPSVEIRPLPEMVLDAKLPERGWRKLTVFQRELADLQGNALFLDLDVIILGELDAFFDVPGEFRIVKDWNLRGSYIGNSSVFRFEIGRYPDILQYYLEHGDAVRQNHRNEQAYLSWCMREKGILQYWDETWCRSFKTPLYADVSVRLFFRGETPRPGRENRHFPRQPKPRMGYRRLALGQLPPKRPPYPLD